MIEKHFKEKTPSKYLIKSPNHSSMITQPPQESSKLVDKRTKFAKPETPVLFPKKKVL